VTSCRHKAKATVKETNQKTIRTNSKFGLRRGFVGRRDSGFVRMCEDMWGCLD